VRRWRHCLRPPSLADCCFLPPSNEGIFVAPHSNKCIFVVAPPSNKDVIMVFS
jgi:hypothetical protein